MRLTEKALYVNIKKNIVVLDPLRYAPLDAYPEVKEELIRIGLTGDKMSPLFKDICLGYYYKNVVSTEKLSFQMYEVTTPTKSYASMSYLDFVTDLGKTDFTLNFRSKVLVAVDLTTLETLCPNMRVEEEFIFRDHTGYVNMGMFDDHPFLQFQVPGLVRPDMKSKVFYNTHLRAA